MARKTRMSKVARMDEASSVLTEDSAEDVIGDVETALEALREWDEARAEAADAFAEAMGYHEEREWEYRNDSLSGANDAVERMDAALATLDDQSAIAVERLEEWQQMVSAAQAHLEQLLDF